MLAHALGASTPSPSLSPPPRLGGTAVRLLHFALLSHTVSVDGEEKNDVIRRYIFTSVAALFLPIPFSFAVQRDMCPRTQQHHLFARSLSRHVVRVKHPKKHTYTNTQLFQLFTTRRPDDGGFSTPFDVRWIRMKIVHFPNHHSNPLSLDSRRLSCGHLVKWCPKGT